MANGTPDRYLAQADRRREMADSARSRSEEAIAAVKESLGPYREEQDSVTETELTVGKDGVTTKLKNAPPWLIMVLSLAALALAAFVAWLYLRR